MIRRREICRRYYLKNKAKVFAANKRWVKANRDKVNARARQWYHANRVACLIRMKKWRKKNKSRRAKLVRAWKTKNPHKVKHSIHKRLELIKSGVDCSNKIQTLHSERFCHWCAVALTNRNRVIDHVIPLSRGGRHVPDNLVAACRPCNTSKHNKLIHEWTWRLAA